MYIAGTENIKNRAIFFWFSRETPQYDGNMSVKPSYISYLECYLHFKCITHLYLYLYRVHCYIPAMVILQRVRGRGSNQSLDSRADLNALNPLDTVTFNKRITQMVPI